MPFLIGCFGKNPQAFAKKIEQIAHERGDRAGFVIAQNEYQYIIADYYKNDIQRSDYPLPICNKQGLLLGKIFNHESFERIASFENQENIILTKNPALLAKNYWGRYAGALYNDAQKFITLVRDPLGLSTIYYMPTADGIFFATDIALIYDCLTEKPSFNMHYFADYIIGKNYALSSTPFNTIFELQPGMGLRFSLDGSIKQELLWDLDANKSSFITDTNEFEQELLRTLKQCTKTWVADSKGVCVELSGGLDSSAVMILLREILSSDQKLIGVNYIDSKEPSSNEIMYAQEVADICDAQLHFIDWQSASLFNDSPSGWRSNQPTTFLLFPGIENQLCDLALSQGCTEIVNGQGGDHVFLAPPLENSIADYWLEKGFKGSGASLRELSAYYRMPWALLLWKNIKGVGNYYRGRTEKQKVTNSFLNRDFARTYTLSQDYLSQATKKHAPAKAMHIQGLAHGVSFADRNQRIPGLTFGHPLLSQPIVELGLRIPTYQSFSSGHDRILFRNAVSRLKNPTALWRKHKGDTTTTAIKTLISNIDRIQAILEQGILLHSGMINKQWLEENIQQMRHGKIDNLWFIIRIISAQCWLNQWKLKC